jgi:hypothetical protein
MSPAVCLGGSVRTALELGAAWAGSAVAQIRANICAKVPAMVSTRDKGKRTTPPRLGLMRDVSGCKEGMCVQVMGKLSRLG